jgi:hypothetical protein
MLCDIMRKECTMWKHNQCEVGGCRKVVDQCKTAGPNDSFCKAITTETHEWPNHCNIFYNPKKKWPKGGRCPMAHKTLVAEVTKAVNPLKASKRAGGK